MLHNSVIPRNGTAHDLEQQRPHQGVGDHVGIDLGTDGSAVHREPHPLDESAALRDAELFVQRFAVTGTRGRRRNQSADEFRIGGFADELAVLDQPPA